jgi:DNA end-binding protein Ku
MAPQPFWKGYLKVALVTCSVGMIPAKTENEKVRFHTLNRKTGHRVVSRYVDSVSGRLVEEDQQAKGYARGADDYILFDDDELEAVGLESTRTIDIETFAPRDSIGWIWYNRAHYLTPNDTVGEEAFCVIRDAMKSTDTVGISRLVLYGRERAVMLKPRAKGIVLWTLRYGEEVRDSADYLGDERATRIDRKELDRVSKLIAKQRAPWSPEMARDPVQKRLLEIIASKKRARKSLARPKARTSRDEETPSNVVNIMDALQKSLSSEKKAKRR